MKTSESDQVEKYLRIYWDEKTKAKQQTSLTMQLEEISQNILKKERGLERDRDRITQHKQKRTSKDNSFSNYSVENAQEQNNNQLQ